MACASGDRGRVFLLECEMYPKVRGLNVWAAACGSILRKAMGPSQGRQASGQASGHEAEGVFHPLQVLAGLLGVLSPAMLCGAQTSAPTVWTLCLPSCGGYKTFGN